MDRTGHKAEKRGAAGSAVVRMHEAAVSLIQPEEPKAAPKHPRRAFQCNKCSRSFATGTELTDHQWTHKKERPYACTMCDKRFLSRSHFREHQRVHTGERPFPCTRCERSFTTMHNLKRHQSIHVKEEAYRCHTCGVLFCHVHKGAKKSAAAASLPKPPQRPPNPSSLLARSVARKKKDKPRPQPEAIQVHCGGDGDGVVTLRRNAGGMHNKIAYDIEVVL